MRAEPMPAWAGGRRKRQPYVRRPWSISLVVPLTAVALLLVWVATPPGMPSGQLEGRSRIIDGDTLEVAKRLVTGSPRQKAEVLRELVQVYNIDINELDSVLTEHISAPKATPTEQAILQRLDRFEQRLSPRQNAEQTSQEDQATINSVKEFAAKNEFFNDVWQDMEMLLTSQRATSIQDAYDKACRMNDSVSKVLEDRKAKDKQRVAASNVSVKGSAPRAKSNPDAGKSLRDVLSDAYDEVMGG